MKKVYSILMMTALLVTTMGLLGCNSDGEQLSSVDLQNYVIGKWTSHHLIAYTTDGREKTTEVTKNNAFSSTYCELTFQKDGKVISEGWQQNTDGSSVWIREIYTYTVNGDFIFIHESKNRNDKISFNVTDDDSVKTRANDTSITLTLDRKNNMLYYRETGTVNGIQMTANLYFIKQ